MRILTNCARRVQRRARAARPCPLLAVLLACLLAAAPPATVAQDELAGQELLNRARAQMADGDPQAAYQSLAPHESRFAGDPAFDYLLGIAALDSGRFTNAVFALERVLAVDPGNVLARAELARAYLALGERETARREFETVSRRDIPEQARQAIQSYLTAFRETPEAGADFKGFIGVSIGYDSNVNAASDVDSVAIPSIPGAVFAVESNAVATGDEFATLLGGLSMSLPVTDSLRFNAGVNGYTKLNEHETQFDTGSINGYAGLDWTRGDTIYTVAGQGEHFKVDHESYRNALGGLLQVRHVISEVSQLTGYAQYARLDYPSQEIRDADRYTLGGAISGILGLGYATTGFIGGYFGLEDPDDNSVDWLEYRFGGLRMGGQMQVHPQVSLFGFANYELRNYEADDPLFQERRQDRQGGVRVGGDWSFADSWTLTPAVDFIRNESNITIHDYTRWIVSATVRLDFD